MMSNVAAMPPPARMAKAAGLRRIVDSAGMMSLLAIGFGHPEIAADLACEMLFYFVVPRHRRAPVRCYLSPPRVAAAFAKQLATVCGEMAHEIAALHTAIGNSS